MMNRMQAEAIRRFHRHLQGLGRAGSLDDSARLWVARFAHLWRLHYATHSQYACAGREGKVTDWNNGVRLEAASA